MADVDKTKKCKYSALEDFDELADVESVCPEIFIGESEEAESLCNLILSLALIYNDFKDLLYGLILLKRRQPRNCFSKYAGQYSGISYHINRLLHSLFCELAKLICDHQDTIRSRDFKKILGSLSKENKMHWETIVKFAQGEHDNNFLDTMIKIRNNIAYHYHQPKVLKQGYRKHFDKREHARSVACVSRGNTLASTRFHFADAAVSGCYEIYLTDKETFTKNTEAIFQGIIKTLYTIIINFIQIRGGAWHKEKVDE